MIIEIREEARGDLHVGYRFYEEQAAGLGALLPRVQLAEIDAIRRFATSASAALTRFRSAAG